MNCCCGGYETSSGTVASAMAVHGSAWSYALPLGRTRDHKVAYTHTPLLLPSRQSALTTPYPPDNSHALERKNIPDDRLNSRQTTRRRPHKLIILHAELRKLEGTR